MARSSQPKIAKRKSPGGSKSQPTLGGHAKKIASQPKLGGNKKRR